MQVDFTLLVLSRTKSEFHDWVHRNYCRVPQEVPLIGAYSLADSEDELPSQYSRIIIYQGPINFATRILHALGKVGTNFVLPIAGDDDILQLRSFESDYPADVYIGHWYFINNGQLFGSACNRLEIGASATETFVSYWSPPLPADSSIFYSVFNVFFYKTHLERLLSESYCALYDGFDWVLISRMLRAGRVFRVSHYTYLRGVTPSMDYVTRVMKAHERNKADFSNWRRLNPLIYPIKLIQEGLPDEVYNQCLSGWFNVIRHKFAQMRQLYPEFVKFDSEEELNRVSAEVTLSIRDTPLDHIIVPLVQ